MKKVDFSKLFKERKTLYLVLGIIVISVFVLSIAYAVLSATLDISGWAEIASSITAIYYEAYYFGVRPVIVISRNYL